MRENVHKEKKGKIRRARRRKRSREETTEEKVREKRREVEVARRSYWCIS